MTRANRRTRRPKSVATQLSRDLLDFREPALRNILWTGTDDGYVWVTQDGGKTWRMSPIISRAARHASVGSGRRRRHAFGPDGSAYVVYDCTCATDYQPHVWRTADFGKTWTEIGQGLRPSAGSPHALRESRQCQGAVRRHVIGSYVTVDAAAAGCGSARACPMCRWSRSRCRTRSATGRGDARRGLWCWPAGPLEELGDSTLGEAAHLFGVPPAYQYREATRTRARAAGRSRRPIPRAAP